MNRAEFVLSKKRLREQINLLEKLKLKIIYSYKTNKEVGKLIQKEFRDIEFSIHQEEEISEIKNKKKIWFFLVAQSERKIKEILSVGVRKIVVGNEEDLKNLLEVLESSKRKIWLSLRMKFLESRIGSGKYFVYGIPSERFNYLINKLRKNPFIEKLGIHVHRKSQNTSEWEIKEELKDSLTEETLKLIDFFNLGGGLPVEYKNYSSKNLNYIFSKIKETESFLSDRKIITYIEPGRFLAAPPIKLKAKIIQIQDSNILINTSIYRCALDSLITEFKMLVEQETKSGKFYLIKGNSPTRDDIFRYKVKLKNPKVGDEITFLNAGAYNYTTDFFGYNKLETKIVK